jgi:hypothetical protein
MQLHFRTQKSVSKKVFAFLMGGLLFLISINIFAKSADTPAYSNEIDASQCPIDMHNLDEVVVAQIAGKVTQHCFSLAAEYKYWPIGVPKPPSNIQKKYTPKGKDIEQYANYHTRDVKIIDSKAEPNVDGKISRSYRIRILISLMQVNRSNQFKPLCEITTEKLQFVKEPWGWFLMFSTLPPGFKVNSLIEAYGNPVETNRIQLTDTEKQIAIKKAREKRRQHDLKNIKYFDSQCKKTF